MKKIQKYKMDKRTYDEYLAQGICFDMERAQYYKNRSALILGKGKAKGKNNGYVNIEVEVLGYFPQTFR